MVGEEGGLGTKGFCSGEFGVQPRSQAVTHGLLWCDNIDFATASVSHTHLGRNEGSGTPTCARGPSGCSARTGV